MGYRLINPWDVGRKLEEFVNNSPAARGLQILLVFYQHPAWFISLQPIETCGLLLNYTILYKYGKRAGLF